MIFSFCWWKKSGDQQLRLVVYPIIYSFFLPSQVVSRISAINRYDIFTGHCFSLGLLGIIWLETNTCFFRQKKPWVQRPPNHTPFHWSFFSLCLESNLALPETNSSHLKMDGWKTSFLLGKEYLPRSFYWMNFSIQTSRYNSRYISEIIFFGGSTIISSQKSALTISEASLKTSSSVTWQALDSVAFDPIWSP